LSFSPTGHRPQVFTADGDLVNGDNGHENGIETQPDAPVIAPSELNVRFKFSSFVVGHNSQFAHAAAKAVAEALATATTRCSSTAESVLARRTSCMRSATRSTTAFTEARCLPHVGAVHQ